MGEIGYISIWNPVRTETVLFKSSCTYKPVEAFKVAGDHLSPTTTTTTSLFPKGQATILSRLVSRASSRHGLARMLGYLQAARSAGADCSGQ